MVVKLQEQPEPRSSIAAVFHGPHKLMELQAFPLPQLGDSEALVRLTCCTICGSDLHTIQGVRNEQTPTVLGHESIGVIERVGRPAPLYLDGKELQIGDRITWSVAVSCGDCDRCLMGLPQKCRELFKYGHERACGPYALSGGMAEHMVLRKGTVLVQLSSKIPDAVACPSNCATATVMSAFHRVPSISGRRVLVFGAGILGLTAVAIASARGASEIAIVDTNDQRLQLALKFGATHIVPWSDTSTGIDSQFNDQHAGKLFDFVLELSGAASAVEAAVRLADVGGHVALVGSVMPSRPVSIDPEQVIRKCLCIFGIHNYAPQDLLDAVQFLERHWKDFPFEELVEQRFSLTDINLAVEFATHQRPIRVAILPSPTLNPKEFENMIETESSADKIAMLFEQRGMSQYGGEAVSQLEHALQAATLAETENAPAELIVAALLHDVGHLLHDLPADAPDQGVDDHHENSGQHFLRQNFPAAVVEPVRMHVDAKRYLCTAEPGYLEQLSEPSKLSLQLQGGPMSAEECQQFESNEFYKESLRLRRWDDLAKIPELATPTLKHFMQYVQKVARH